MYAKSLALINPNFIIIIIVIIIIIIIIIIQMSE